MDNDVSLFTPVTAILLIVVCIMAVVRFWTNKQFTVKLDVLCTAADTNCETVSCDDVYAKITGCTQNEDISVKQKYISGTRLEECLNAGTCSV